MTISPGCNSARLSAWPTYEAPARKRLAVTGRSAQSLTDVVAGQRHQRVNRPGGLTSSENRARQPASPSRHRGHASRENLNCAMACQKGIANGSQNSSQPDRFSRLLYRHGRGRSNLQQGLARDRCISIPSRCRAIAGRCARRAAATRQIARSAARRGRRRRCAGAYNENVVFQAVFAGAA